ncbi:hypothetical protein BH24ACT15_BH24ACT15_27100 [soil metagenome]
MQLVVLGMHRSGTSATAGVLNLMGAYVGPEGSTVPPNEFNAKGFFERNELRAVCDQVLHSLDAEWWKQSAFDVADIDLTERESARKSFADLVDELDQHRPWVIKEPRLCLLLGLFGDLLTTPVAVITHRDPVEIAMSLQTRNHIPMAMGIALWEHYMRQALANSRGMQRVVVGYDQLVADPVGTAQHLHTELTEKGVNGLQSPRAAAVRSFLASDLHHHQATGAWSEWLNPAQIELALSLQDGTALTRPAGEVSAGGRHLLDQLLHERTVRREVRDLRRRIGRMAQSNAATASELTQARLTVSTLQDGPPLDWGIMTATTDQSRKSVGAHRKNAFDQLLGLFPVGACVDLGAGHGAFSRQAAEKGWQVTAVDARSERMPDDPRITWTQADIRDVDMAPFDVVACLGLFDHLTLDDQLDLIRRCAGKPMIIDTHIDTGGSTHSLSDRREVGGYEGRMYNEPGKTTSSWKNPQSFWPTLPSFHRMLDDNGFGTVLTLEPWYLPDRTFFLALPDA